MTMTAMAGEPLTQLKPNLWVGGQPDQAQPQFAKDGGAVIDLRTAQEERGLMRPRPLPNCRSLPIDSHTGITADNACALHEALAAATGPVLLHCRTGNRVGALLALDAVAQGSSSEQALELARRAGVDVLGFELRERLGCGPQVR
ncbi:MAG: sulfur transferase domain-containing protein [Aquamicrobium sp.]|uniref:beta-lactamase hydrolase domain-containing protein n=1 Tax=Aquamicrobium sp. TaxID=1872579 RepID=UPI00349EA83C|nr:sulfur transferase domain-containing protein [Aquamicrobium sp.]